MPANHTWRPIADFESDPKTLTDGELESLSRVWADEKRDLIDPQSLEEFDKRLRREWSIETGIIENVYTLDRGVTRTLIEKGIDAAFIPHGASDRDGVVVAQIIRDHYEALDGMFDFVGGQRELSTGYIKELHAALLRNQETHTVVDQFGHPFEKVLEKGAYKTAPNSPTRPDGTVHEYCPPEHVASEMDRLVALHREHKTGAVPPEVESAWLHHRFTQIHPFADGNGRVARAIASLVFIKAGLFPLVVDRDDRTRYIDALEKADGGDVRPLVGLFVEAQRKALLQASEVAYEVKPPSSADDAIAAIRNRLLQRGKVPVNEWHSAKAIANRLENLAALRLREIERQLTQELGGRGYSFSFSGGQSAPPDVVFTEVLRQAAHTANLEEFDTIVRLSLNAGRPDSISLSFHALGPRYRGLIAVVPFLFIQGIGATLIEGGTFQINYAEGLTHAQTRFAAWLERVIVAGLNQWRLTL